MAVPPFASECVGTENSWQRLRQRRPGCAFLTNHMSMVQDQSTLDRRHRPAQQEVPTGRQVQRSRRSEERQPRARRPAQRTVHALSFCGRL